MLMLRGTRLDGSCCYSDAGQMQDPDASSSDLGKFGFTPGAPKWWRHNRARVFTTHGIRAASHPAGTGA
jgi:hypothetical protein